MVYRVIIDTFQKELITKEKHFFYKKHRKMLFTSLHFSSFPNSKMKHPFSQERPPQVGPGVAPKSLPRLHAQQVPGQAGAGQGSSFGSSAALEENSVLLSAPKTPLPNRLLLTLSDSLFCSWGGGGTGGLCSASPPHCTPPVLQSLRQQREGGWALWTRH